MRTKRTVVLVGFTVLAAAACGGTDGGSGPNPPPGVISLALGEARTITPSNPTALEVSGGSAGAEFVLIPFHGSQAAGNTVALDFTATQVGGVTGPPTPYIGAATGGVLSNAAVASAASFNGAKEDVAFHLGLRRLERELAPRMPAARAARAARSDRSGASYSVSAAAPVPAVGDQMVLNTERFGGCAPTAVRTDRTGRVAAVTQFAVIVADNANPVGGFTDAEYLEIGQAFDATVQPVVTQNFGTAVDIDANAGRNVIFYTRAVNELTLAGSESVVGGFFHPRDLFPRVGSNPSTTDDDCPASNEAEMFYMLVPDPIGEVNGNIRTKASVRRATVGVLAHEYQHLVNGSRRIYVNDASSFEEVWLNEGLSHIAEELMFYRVSGLAPRQNINITTLRSSQTILDAVNAYQVSNFGRLLEYLEDPEIRSPYMADDELATRGATWQLLRYAADRSATAEQTLWFNFANSRTAGIANFNAVIGTEIVPSVRAWATAQYTDDAVTGAGTALQHPSWNFRSILPVLLNSSNPPPYPLKTRTLVAGTPVTLSLRGGSPAYLRFSVGGGGTGTIAVALSGGGAVPSSVSLTVVRTK